MTDLYNIDAEKTVLGAILRDQSWFATLGLSDSDFYNTIHARMFTAMRQLFDAKIEISLVSTMSKMPSEDIDKVGGVRYFADMMDYAAPGADPAYYVGLIRDAATSRRVVALLDNHKREIVDGGNASGEAVELIKNISEIIKPPDNARAIEKAHIEFSEQLRTGKRPRRLDTWRDVDWVLGGLKDKKFYILAGRPGMGKTAVAIELVRRAAMQGRRALFISLEMDGQEVLERMLCARVRKASDQLSDVDAPELDQIVNEIKNDCLMVDKGSIKSADIRLMAQTHGASIVFIDYLQLVQEPTMRIQHERIEAVARQCKAMAMDFSIPVVALAQLNRNCEERTPPRPRLDDLKGSGGLEEAADSVIFLYRESYYNQEHKNEPGPLEFIVAKNRGGAVGTKELFYTPAHHCIEQIEQRYDYQQYSGVLPV